jgi:hypothetical protein
MVKNFRQITRIIRRNSIFGFEIFPDFTACLFENLLTDEGLPIDWQSRIPEKLYDRDESLSVEIVNKD